MCRITGVSRTGFAAWLKRTPSPREQQNRHILTRIEASYDRSDKTYGSPRIYHDLLEEGIACSPNRVARIMRANEIVGRPLVRYAAATDSNHALPVAPNLLNQNFNVAQPNIVWSTDMTYIWTSEGWLYLAVVLDLFNRKAVGWTMKSTIDRTIVIDALQAAIAQRHPAAGLICHSDRGSQYASFDYQKALKQAGAICSMSGKGNCYDNAPAESFFASLKRELVYRRSFRTRAEARAAVFAWITTWYNRKRRHSKLGFVSPDRFELNYNQFKTIRKAA